MPGPPPNPNARRTNRRDDGFHRLPARREGPAPELPHADWHPATAAAWAVWWSSPQATQWQDSDLPSLYLMALAYDAATRGERSGLVEYRHWADRFGLSPLGRLRNRWLLADTQVTTDTGPTVLHSVPLGAPEHRSSLA